MWVLSCLTSRSLLVKVPPPQHLRLDHHLLPLLRISALSQKIASLILPRTASVCFPYSCDFPLCFKVYAQGRENGVSGVDVEEVGAGRKGREVGEGESGVSREACLEGRRG